MAQGDEEFRERTWKLLNAYYADAGARRCARDADGRPNVYNTIHLILRELFPERMADLESWIEASGL